MRHTPSLRALVALGTLFIAYACGDDASEESPLAMGGASGTGTGGSRGGTDAGAGAGGAPDRGGGGAPGTPDGGAPSDGGSAGNPAGGGNAGAGGEGGNGGVPGALCEPIPACDAAPPALETLDWNHMASELTAASGDARHRGRDLLLNPGDPQWIIAKFAYGNGDTEIKDERVDIYLLRDCGEAWELLGSANTTEDGEHATIEGVDDTGGRVYFEVPSGLELGVGRHRVRLIVRGDGSSADLFIDVVPKGTPLVLTDIDGTLTDNDAPDYVELLSLIPAATVNAVDVMNTLVDKGYRPFYVSARPEWLTAQTREFLSGRGFPSGTVHTTLTTTGVSGAAETAFKTAELAALAERELVPAWAFGDSDRDATAFENAGILPLKQRILFQFTDTTYGARRIESYADLLDELSDLPDLCE